MAPSSTMREHEHDFKHGHPDHWQPLDCRHAAGFTQPTHVSFRDPKTRVKLHWNSRAHRKGRYPSAVVDDADPSWKVKRRFPRLVGVDLRDISWHVAVLFLLGSVFWSEIRILTGTSQLTCHYRCFNGTMDFVFYTVSTDAILNAEAATAFIGGTLFWIGGYLSFVESLNPSRDTDFGYEVESEAHKLHTPSHKSKGSLGRSRQHFGKHHQARPDGDSNEKSSSQLPAWRWWGADWSSLGYVANAIQFFGASILCVSLTCVSSLLTSFAHSWVSTICGLPGVLPEDGSSLSSSLSSRSIALWEVFFWAPQIIGAPCFVISGYMFMLEVQDRWWKPKLFSLGWHLGFWNAVGGLGFWACGIGGVMRETGGSDAGQKWGTVSDLWGLVHVYAS